MQETLRKTLKRVAAIGTSAAMVGMTLTGALAADLSNYPAPFDGANTVFVVGASASSEDGSAAQDIVAGLPKSAGSVTGGVTTGQEDVKPATTALTDYEKLEDPTVGEAFNATTHFGNTITADDIEGLQDTTVNIDIDDVADDYDVRDEIRFGGNQIDPNALLSAHTALTFDADEDWKDRVFVPMEPNSWGYYYVFEDALKQGNFIANASTTDAIELEFLGKLFEVEGISTGTATDEMIVNVGQKFYMDAGDCVTVDGKEVCLISTSTAANTPATISVDGVREVVNANSEEIINGLEVRVEDVSADEGIEYDSATLYVGEQARETFHDNDEFVGEDKDDPAWRWDLANIDTANPRIGILWSLSLDNPEESDNPLYEHPLYEGEAICLPFDYACVVFDSLQIDDYQDYSMQAGVAKDLYYNVTHADANVVDQVGEKVIEFSAKGSSDNGFITGTDINNAATIESDTVYLSVNCNTGALQVYRAEQDGNDAILFAEVRKAPAATLVWQTLTTVNQDSDAASYQLSGSEDVFQIDYRDTLMNVDLDWAVPANATAADQQDETYSDSEFEPGAQTHGASCNNSLAWNTYSYNTTSNLTTLFAPAYGVMMINPANAVAENISIYFETDENAIQSTNGEWNDFEYLGDSKGDTVTAYDVVYGDWNHTKKVRYAEGVNLTDNAAAAANLFDTAITSGDLYTLADIGNVVNGMPATQTAIDISGWEEDTRTPEGVIILDPEAHQSSDKFEMRVPSDASDFKTNVIVRTSGAAGSGARLRQDVETGSAAGPAVMKDSDVADLTQYNAIVVGGPCVNKYAAELLGLTFPTCGDSGSLPFGPGEAVIELKKNGSNYALLVAGYEAEDTRRAGVVLENYAQFKLSGESKKVKGEGIEVAGITLE